jgi:rRNA maturation endonuclease Nob1
MDLISKAVNYVKDTAEWVASGIPYRSKVAIDVIFTEVCQPCEYFKQGPVFDYGTCEKCGCPLKRAGRNRNKIAWATSKCPEGKWGNK